MNKPRIINLFAGPGTGKSTTAAALFAELKYRGHDVLLAAPMSGAVTMDLDRIQLQGGGTIMSTASLLTPQQLDQIVSHLRQNGHIT